MARSLLVNLNAAMFDHLRKPSFKIYVYDILSGGDSVDDIVREQTLATLTGPRDFTADCVQVGLNDQAGDFVETGIPVSQIVVDISDPLNQFDPYNTIVAPSGDGRWLREGNVVRILEGDERVDEEEWEWTFTGMIVGQAGVDRGRVGYRARLTFKALSRESAYLNMVNTTDTYGDGMTYKEVAEDIATVDMALHPDVVVFPNIGTDLTRQTSTQFGEESPLVSIAHIFFVDLYLPRFNGKGELTATSGDVTQYPARVYDDEEAGNIISITRPYTDEKRINAVRILGLDAGLTRVDAPRQELGTLEITTGYFAHNEKVYKHWSEDHTLLADNVTMRKIQSVAGGLTALGGEESMTLIPAHSGEGSIGCYVTIGTGFAPYLLVILLVVYLALAVVPDAVFPWETISIGRIAQAIALSGAMITMTMIGRGSYQFIGTPFQYVYKELRREARETGVTHATRNGIEIRNDLLTYQAALKSVARDLLFRFAAKSNPRVITMMIDLRLEPDDVFEYQGRRYLIQSISRTIGRAQRAVMTVNCYEVTAGVTA